MCWFEDISNRIVEVRRRNWCCGWLHVNMYNTSTGVVGWRFHSDVLAGIDLPMVCRYNVIKALSVLSVGHGGGVVREACARPCASSTYVPHLPSRPCCCAQMHIDSRALRVFCPMPAAKYVGELYAVAWCGPLPSA